MAFEPFYHFMRGIQGRVFGGSQAQNAQQIAQMRQLQRDLNSENTLKIPLSELPVVVFDLETTGFFPDQGDEIISIGAIKVVGNSIREDVFYSLIHCEKALPEHIKQLTGINDQLLMGAPPLSEVLVKFFKFVQDDALVAHHANHERSFLQQSSKKLFRTPFIHRIVDTSFLFRVSDPTCKLSRLEDYCEHNGISVFDRHHALGDAKLTAELWCIYIKKLQEMGCRTLKDVYERMARL
jgi:DNA polymerase-3 subunit epsilon